MPERVTVVLDAALAEFAADADDPAALAGERAEPARRALVLQGARAGRAPRRRGARPAGARGAARAERRARRAGAGRGRLGRERRRHAAAARRRAAAAAARRQLATALAGSALALAPGAAPFAWLSSRAEDGPALAARLAASRILVAPGRLWGDERHVRAALGGPEVVDRLVDALVG